jgi:hypothetical protein
MMHHHDTAFASGVPRIVAATSAGVRHRLLLQNGLD